MPTDTARHRLDDPDLLRVRDVADLFGVHERTVRRWIEAGDLPAVRHARRHVRVARRDVEAFAAMRPASSS